MLQSKGGSVDTLDQIHQIKEQKTVVINGLCGSVCVYLTLRHKKIIIKQEGIIAVHGPRVLFFDDALYQVLHVNTYKSKHTKQVEPYHLTRYYRWKWLKRCQARERLATERGIDPAFFWVWRTSYNSIDNPRFKNMPPRAFVWYPTPEQFEAFGIDLIRNDGPKTDEEIMAYHMKSPIKKYWPMKVDMETIEAAKRAYREAGDVCSTAMSESLNTSNNDISGQNVYLLWNGDQHALPDDPRS